MDDSRVEEARQVPAQGDKVEEENVESPPEWLPDGWIMEVYRTDNGTINRYYTSPVSGYTFTMKSEVLEYLFSGIDERLLETKQCAAKISFLTTHNWLPKGWVIEIRAGGKNMDKMYKFYVHPQTGVRLQSKEDVRLYIKEMKTTICDTNGECDLSLQDNILANVELNPEGLPNGWVKEDVFRKTKKGVRKDPYYTDPASRCTFRSLKSAVHYVETGKMIKRDCIDQTISVYDMYAFDKSADLHKSLRSRLTIMRNADDEKQAESMRRDEDFDTSTGPTPPNEPEAN
ncbi:hypothetical protein ACP70R_027056 [Stipagrostis hirtigluma subsp. patula]